MNPRNSLLLSIFFLSFWSNAQQLEATFNKSEEELYYWSSGVDFPKPDFMLQKRRDMLWGVLGHPTRLDHQYGAITLDEQVDYLKALGVNIYRISYDVGELDLTQTATFASLLGKLQDNEIEAFPVIMTKRWRGDPIFLGNNWNYATVVNYINNNDNQGQYYIKDLDIWEHYFDLGFNMGKEFAEDYTGINYYGIGNEMAHRIVNNFLHCEDDGTNNFFYHMYDGDEMEDFFSCETYAQRTIASAAIYSGMIDGIKDENECAKGVINGNRINFGYFEFLEYMEVQYDIVGYNYYGNNFQNYLNRDLHDELTTVSNNKPIWITEVNRVNGSFVSNSDNDGSATEEQSEKLRRYIQELYQLPNIKAIIQYELIDQLYYGPSSHHENHYGLITVPLNGTNQNAVLKPAFNTYRYSIEEFRYGYDDFFFSYYKKYADREEDLLNANAQNNPIGYWSGQMMNGEDLVQILEYMIKVDCRSFIKETFSKLLGVENPTQEALDYYWSVVNEDNLLFEAVIADVVSSNQFYGHAQDSNYNDQHTNYPSENFIRYAFSKLTEGTYIPSQSEILDIYNNYTNLSNDRAQRRTIARDIIMELDEYKEQVLINQFKKYLDRSDSQLAQDPSGIQWHLNNYTDQKSKIRTHLLSDDFWRRSIVRGYNYRHNNELWQTPGTDRCFLNSIVAYDDTCEVSNWSSQTAQTCNILDNDIDILSGLKVEPHMVDITLLTSLPPEIELDIITGKIDIDENLTPGTYQFTYQICLTVCECPDDNICDTAQVKIVKTQGFGTVHPKIHQFGENTQSNDINFWPNPASDIFNIQWDNSKEKTLKDFAVYSIKGQSISTKAVSSRVSNLSLDFSDYSNGVYFISLIFDDGQIKWIRAIKK